MIEIDKTLPLHDFPDIYNRNNQDLLDIITNLQKKLTDAETQHKEDIASMMKLYKEMSAKYIELSDKLEEIKNSFISSSTFEQSVKQIINQNTNSK